MKKLIIVILVVIFIIIGVYSVSKLDNNIEKVLSKFESYETDGYYDSKHGTEFSGYIVSNKTTEGYRYGYVNYKGKILLDAKYNKIYRLMDIKSKDKIYLIAVKDGRYGVNLNGKDIIDYQYQFIEYNSTIESFILQKTNSYGVANLKGKIVVPVQNESLEIKGTHIYVSNNGESKVYEPNGKEAKLNFNTSINPTENENYFIEINENGEEYFYGIVDKNEKELVAPKYTYIEYLFDDYFIACNKDRKEGIIDNKNNTILQFNYNIVQQIQNTNLIRTLDNETSKTEIYSKNFEKICTMKNCNIEKDGNTIKVYNEEETKYFNIDGIEINN